MLALVAIGLMPIPSQATFMLTDRDDFISAVAPYADVDLNPVYAELSTITAGSPIALPFGQTLTFDIDMTVRQVGSSWVTWSNGNTPRVLYAASQFGQRQLLCEDSGLWDGNRAQPV